MAPKAFGVRCGWSAARSRRYEGSGVMARCNYVELDPEIQPAHIFRVRRWTGGDRFAWQLGG